MECFLAHFSGSAWPTCYRPSMYVQPAKYVHLAKYMYLQNYAKYLHLSCLYWKSGYSAWVCRYLAHLCQVCTAVGKVRALGQLWTTQTLICIYLYIYIDMTSLLTTKLLQILVLMIFILKEIVMSQTWKIWGNSCVKVMGVLSTTCGYYGPLQRPTHPPP